MPQPSTALTTILFTDLVSSTELLQRAGDEDAQRIFKAHHKLLSGAVAAAGGQEVKWLGDGLMVAFPSAADAVRCAVAMQRSSRRQISPGERLEIRVGLHAGEALIDESDYFGTTVVIARRLCDTATSGQILCSGLVSGLLAGRQAFAFRDIGPLALKGITAPVPSAEVLYERDEPAAFLTAAPFVGRTAEVAKLTQKLHDAEDGRGALVMLVGEPGIGKTRTTEEFAATVRAAGGRVLWGRCFEGEWSPPYAPFAEAIELYARDADPDELRADLGYGAAPIARLVPSLRDRLPDIEEPAPLQPDEERFRLLDAVSQFLIATSRRAPVLLVLDDLHWADRGTIAMMRHVARFAQQQRMLVVGAYRDVELDRQHPLADALAALRRETEYERIVLKGLPPEDVGTLLETIAEQQVAPDLVQAISDETDGNPFFIREVLLHLVDEGKLYREDGQWRNKASSIADLGIPEGVRQVITRRLSRLSDAANKLLSTASAFSGGFRFDRVARAAGIDEAAALDAIDEALDAQLLRAGAGADHYDFTHALIRHTLYGEMNPSRQVRLHRQIAEAMEDAPERERAAHAAELAYQYHRSAAIPGAERGVPHALAAANAAEQAAAWDEMAAFLRMAQDLLPEDDSRRPRVLARLATTLAFALSFDEGLETAKTAGALLAESEGRPAAAKFFADATMAFGGAGHQKSSWELAELGIQFIDDVRDKSWVILMMEDLLRRESEDPEAPGIPVNTPERNAIVQIAADILPKEEFYALMGYFFMPRMTTREEILSDRDVAAMPLVFWAGDYDRGGALFREAALLHERQGRIAWAVSEWSQTARCHAALGKFDEAVVITEHASVLARRLTTPSVFTLQVLAAQDEYREAIGEGFENALEQSSTLASQPDVENNWALAAIRAGGARVFAWLGMTDGAHEFVSMVVPAIDGAPASAINYVRLACNAAQTFWILNGGAANQAEIIERNILAKIIAPDFRYPGVDGRLALAQLCALGGRDDEARAWFAKARVVLDEQGARPLRAIVDYDEALMYARRGAQGDAALALPLIEAALPPMREIGMTGWVRRAEALRASLASSE